MMSVAEAEEDAVVASSSVKWPYSSSVLLLLRPLSFGFFSVDGDGGAFPICRGYEDDDDARAVDRRLREDRGRRRRTATKNKIGILKDGC